MTLKIRRVLFYSFLGLFIVIGNFLVIYSMGWRVSIQNCDSGEDLNNVFWQAVTCGIDIQKTGAIYIETKPKGVTIKIDGIKYEDKSGILQRGTLISDLVPKNYKLEISKDGYDVWKKTLKVLPELVNETQEVILVPKNINKEKIELLRIRGDEIEKITNDNKLILKDTKTSTYYFYDLNNTSIVSNINLSFKNLKGNASMKNIAFHPFDSARLIIESDKGLDIFDNQKSRLENISQIEPLAWTIGGSNIYYLLKTKTGSYEMLSFNLIVKNGGLVFETSDSNISKEIFFEIKISGSLSKIGLLANSGKLYIFNDQTKVIDEIGQNILDFSFSPDNKKIAFLDKNNKISVLFLEDWNKNNYKKAGDVFSFTPANKTENVSWYENSYYLLLGNSHNLRLTDLDDREPINNQAIAKDECDNIRYDNSSNSFYCLKDTNFYKFRIE